jgi:hypothetical protein
MFDPLGLYDLSSWDARSCFKNCGTWRQNGMRHFHHSFKEGGWSLCIFEMHWCVRKYCNQTHLMKIRSSPSQDMFSTMIRNLWCVVSSRDNKQVKIGMSSQHKLNFLSDRLIVLAWLAAQSANWSTFITNWVLKIQDNTWVEEWRHAKTSDNPSDLVSRGASVKQLTSSSLWWNVLT